MRTLRAPCRSRTHANQDDPGRAGAQSAHGPWTKRRSTCPGGALRSCTVPAASSPQPRNLPHQPGEQVSQALQQRPRAMDLLPHPRDLRSDALDQVHAPTAPTVSTRCTCCTHPLHLRARAADLLRAPDGPPSAADGPTAAGAAPTFASSGPTVTTRCTYCQHPMQLLPRHRAPASD